MTARHDATEAVLLAACMNGKRYVNQAAEHVTAEDFSMPQHAAVWEEILNARDVRSVKAMTHVVGDVPDTVRDAQAEALTEDDVAELARRVAHAARVRRARAAAAAYALALDDITSLDELRAAVAVFDAAHAELEEFLIGQPAPVTA